MKKVMRKVALVLASVMMMGLLSGCGSFDASAYLAALLDNSYKNDSTAIVEQKIATAEEAAALYEEGLDTKIDVFVSSFGISEEQAESLRASIADMLSKVKYTVGEAEKQDDDSYVVTVTYEQMNVFAPLLENYMATVEEMVNAWTEAALAGEATPSEDEMMDEVLAAFGTTLEEVLANVTYAEPQTMTVRIELVDGMYTPNESDLYNLEYALFDNDAVE